ncbi:MAG TPA: ZIP family zinc transporter [Thermoanaerobaculia bacterium]|jgi:ZIP family zinc transporter
MIAAAAWGALASAALLVGAFLALHFRLPERFVGVVMGFGSGALISSIAYELVPGSKVRGSGVGMVVAFAAGAVVFFAADRFIDQAGGGKRKNLKAAPGSGSGSAIFLGTLLDGVPESLVLGMGLATGGAISVAFLVAVFVSNVPEGVAGTRSLVATGRTPGRVVQMWFAVVAASAVAAAFGWVVVHAIPAADGRYASAFAGGAVLTMLADAMMPEAFEHGGKAVGLAATLGFLAAAVLSVTE